jgi:hypothetical protein
MYRSSLQGRIIHNVLARTIGRHGLCAPKKVWEKGLSIPHMNHLFGARYNEKTMSVEFRTDPLKIPHMILAEEFLEGGVNLTIPLVATADGQLELDTRKGNLPTRWPLMLHDLVFSNKEGYSRDATVVSYTNPSFNAKCMDTGMALNIKHDGLGFESRDKIDEMNKGSYVHITNKLYDPNQRIDLREFVAFYKHGLGSCYLHIDKGPPVTDEVLQQTDPAELKKRSRYGAGERSESYWWTGDQTSSMSTKMFTDKCVSVSNDFQKYYCDIACSQGSLGFPISSHYLAMHILFGKNSDFTSKFDAHNDYYVRDGWQFEELVVLHENIKKYGGSSTLRSNLEYQYANSTIPSKILDMSDAILKRRNPVNNIMTTS